MQLLHPVAFVQSSSMYLLIAERTEFAERSGTYMWCSVAPEKLRVWRGPWCGTFVWRGGALVVSVADQGQKVGILVQSATNISG